jgi:glutamine amidotransferase
MTDVAVIDYGVGNLLSVSRALGHCGASVDVTDNPDRILNARRVVLPGVGAFANGMGALEARGLVDVLREVSRRNQPLLGICLGMQMLLDASEEFGETAGLGLIGGRVVPVPMNDAHGKPQKIPHIGWNSLVLGAANTWDDTLLEGVAAGESVYFVHSYMAQPDDQRYRLADCIYGGAPVSAVIKRGNVMGCQFHPEKSGLVGLQVLKNFLQH